MGAEAPTDFSPLMSLRHDLSCLALRCSSASSSSSSGGINEIGTGIVAFNCSLIFGRPLLFFFGCALATGGIPPSTIGKFCFSAHFVVDIPPFNLFLPRRDASTIAASKEAKSS